MKRKWLAIGIILLFIGTCIIPSTAQKINETDASTFEGKPDLTIVGIVPEPWIDYSYLNCIIKNIGTAPSENYRFKVDGYIVFGLLRVYENHIYAITQINPGDTRDVRFGCPQPFIGVIRLRCFINTSIPEENYYNNRFAHSYFILNLNPLWFFKELPY